MIKLNISEIQNEISKNKKLLKRCLNKILIGKQMETKMIFSFFLNIQLTNSEVAKNV